MKLYSCFWLGLPEVRPFVAAQTRGKAKWVTCLHCRMAFPDCEFTEIRASRASRADEGAFLSGELLPQLTEAVISNPVGEWQ